MTFPKNKLNNPYYFINEDVVYEISEKQDVDNCGEHLVTYETKTKTVETGKKYLDIHGTPVLATEEGEYEVSTGKLDIEACKAVFPYICISYKKSEEDDTIYEEYLWLDYLIKDGDTISDGKFIINQEHYLGENSGSYIGVYRDQLAEMVRDLAAGGYTVNEINKRLPDYVAAEAGDRIEINGKSVIFESLSNSEDADISLTEEDILIETYAVYNEMVVAYANRLLARVNKKLASDTVIVNKDTVVDSRTCKLTIEQPSSNNDGESVAVNVLGYISCDYDGDLTQIPYGTEITITWNKRGDVAVSELVSLYVNNVKRDSPYTFNITEDTVAEIKMDATPSGPGGDIGPNIDPIVITYSLTLPEASKMGTVTATQRSVGDNEVEIGDLTSIRSRTRITVTATPNEGYILGRFLANGVEVDNPYRFNISEDTVITADFALKLNVVE